MILRRVYPRTRGVTHDKHSILTQRRNYMCVCVFLIINVYQTPTNGMH